MTPTNTEKQLFYRDCKLTTANTSNDSIKPWLTTTTLWDCFLCLVNLQSTNEMKYGAYQIKPAE